MVKKSSNWNSSYYSCVVMLTVKILCARLTSTKFDDSFAFCTHCKFAVYIYIYISGQIPRQIEFINLTVSWFHIQLIISCNTKTAKVRVYFEII